MKVGHVTERGDSGVAASFLDGEDLERSAADLGNTGSLQLMARLSEGENIELWVIELMFVALNYPNPRNNRLLRSPNTQTEFPSFSRSMTSAI